jgi:hypothetical protein
LQNVAVARANEVKTNAVADVTMNAEADFRYPNLLRPMTEINPRTLTNTQQRRNVRIFASDED